MAYDRTIPGAVSPEREERLRAWAQRKPRVALMGEFSAGKSTLLNFLIEEELIPTRATATEVPPVWFAYGEGGTHWVDAQGDRHDISAAEIGSVPMSARYVRMFAKAEILEHCDIVDTPGISDPNLAVESWRFAAGVANMVLWCSSATQAWRETERSAWLSLPERLRKHSLLIVTRADKLVAEGDRDKVHRRLARETVGLFRDRIFMATPDAVRAKSELSGGESSPLWEASGAAALLDGLAGRFEEIYEERGALLRQHLSGASSPVEQAPTVPEAEVSAELEAPSEPPMSWPSRPVRVPPGTNPRRSERLRPEDADAMLAKLRTETPVAAVAETIDAAAEAESAVVEEAFFGADDDKDDRALRDALGLDEPVVAAPEAADSEPGESAFAAEEAPEAVEAESDAAMWDAPEEAEAPAEAADSEPRETGLRFSSMRSEFAAEAESAAGTEAVAEPEETAEGPAEAELSAEAEDAAEYAESAMAFEMAERDVAAAMTWSEDAEPESCETVAEEPAEAAVEAEAEAAVDAEAEVAAEVEPEAELMAEAEPEAAVKDEAELMAELESEAAVETEAEMMAEAEPEAWVEDEAEVMAEAEPEAAVEPERPYLLDAGHSVAAGQPQAAEVPRAVSAWREIVARTELLPGNAQIAAMIEELLMVLEAEEAVSETAATAGTAPEPALEAETAEPGAAVAGEAQAEAAESEEAEDAPESLSGWRRLA